MSNPVGPQVKHLRKRAVRDVSDFST